jgi:hypothetical protein
MIETQQTPSLLQGLLTEKQFAAETGWGYRTRLRREAQGLPVIRIGGTKLYPADRVREWILSHLRQQQTAPRTRGRPRKAVVAA